MMKHPSIRALYKYWNDLRGRRLAPERSDIEPTAISRVLADTFVLGFEPRWDHTFRIAGTRVCALFGRDVRSETFLDLWSVESRSQMRTIVGNVAKETVGMVASTIGLKHFPAKRGIGFSPALTLSSPRKSHDYYKLKNISNGGAVGGNPDAADAWISLELLLLPLTHHGRVGTGLLGALVPSDPPYWLGNHVLSQLTVGTYRYVGPAPEGRICSIGRRRNHLVVHSGGLV